MSASHLATNGEREGGAGLSSTGALVSGAPPVPFDLPDGAATAAKRFPARPLHILLATTGSVASVKAPLIVKALLGVSVDKPPRIIGTSQRRMPAE